MFVAGNLGKTRMQYIVFCSLYWKCLHLVRTCFGKKAACRRFIKLLKNEDLCSSVSLRLTYCSFTTKQKTDQQYWNLMCANVTSKPLGNKIFGQLTSQLGTQRPYCTNVCFYKFWYTLQLHSVQGNKQHRNILKFGY